MQDGRAFTVAIAMLALASPSVRALAQEPAAANECRPSLGSSSAESPGTLAFYGAVGCRDPARLEGVTELFAPDGTSEARGSAFRVEGTSARSDGSLFPAPEGSEHTLVFTLRMTSLDGRSWDAEPSAECRSDGPELSCVFRRTVRA